MTRAREAGETGRAGRAGAVLEEMEDKATVIAGGERTVMVRDGE